MKRWTLKHWIALGVLVAFVGVLGFNILRNRDTPEVESNAEESTAASTSQAPTPSIDPDEKKRLIEEQAESGEPESGPGELPVGEEWFDGWKPAAEQLGMAFVDTSQGEKEWSETMTGMMTDRLAKSYESVDVRNVPQGSYEGVVLDESSSTWDSVWVTIKYDTFSMKVRFRHHNDQWLAEEIQPL
ncbi:hypothetical protein [Brevibacterium aurantiacum]|uniref:Uncharacterized protein n=1 Tax=Brevibacterium aurantiacum TaxID=273384 RepID=A0A2H1KBG4_BREAU|nr:hypothetical protein [Brevibacterium aurantiacum]SMX97145.1 hypothetical protein BAURA63_03170 [Brevibacterium aurantiacum]